MKKLSIINFLLISFMILTIEAQQCTQKGQEVNIQICIQKF